MSATCEHPDDEAVLHPECAGCATLTHDVAARAEREHQARRARDAAAWQAPSQRTIADDIRDMQHQLAGATAIPAALLGRPDGSGSYALGQVEERRWRERHPEYGTNGDGLENPLFEGGPWYSLTPGAAGCSGHVHRFTQGPEDAFPWRCPCGAQTADRVDGVFKVFPTPSRPLAELRADLDELAEVREVLRDHEEWTGGAVDDQARGLMQRRCGVVERLVSSVIAGRSPSAHRGGEVSALLDAPRPGSWFGDPSADGRMLTQEQTDGLVRAELSRGGLLRHAEELNAILGDWKSIALETHPDLHGDVFIVRAHRQRGGIDSDPLVRLLAFRAWGDRDRRWFDERGVRKGESVALDMTAVNSVSLAWPGEMRIGAAEDDARPGQQVWARSSFMYGAAPARTLFLVGDRLRDQPSNQATPEQVVMRTFGFDEFWIERDATRGAASLFAGRGGQRVSVQISQDVLRRAQETWRVVDEYCVVLDDMLTQRGAPRTPQPIEVVRQLYGFDELRIERGLARDECAVVAIAGSRGEERRFTDFAFEQPSDRAGFWWSVFDGLAHHLGLPNRPWEVPGVDRDLVRELSPYATHIARRPGDLAQRLARREMENAARGALLERLQVEFGFERLQIDEDRARRSWALTADRRNSYGALYRSQLQLNAQTVIQAGNELAAFRDACVQLDQYLAGQGAPRIRFSANDANSSAGARLSRDFVDAIAYGARAAMHPPPQRPEVVSPLEYELLVRREIREAIARGDSRRRIVRDIARGSTLTTERVAELVDRELAEVTAAPRAAVPDENAKRPAPRSPPPVPPWARDRRRRGSPRPGR